MSKSNIIVLVVVLIGAGAFFFFRQSKNTVTDTVKPEMQESQENGIISDMLPAEADSGVNTKSMVTKVNEITLTVSSPSDGATVTSSKITVSGKTIAGAEVFANEAEGRADKNGFFSLSVAMDEGENSIIVTAVDEMGNVAETEILVTYNAGE